MNQKVNCWSCVYFGGVVNPSLLLRSKVVSRMAEHFHDGARTRWCFRVSPSHVVYWTSTFLQLLTPKIQRFLCFISQITTLLFFWHKASMIITLWYGLELSERMELTRIAIIQIFKSTSSRNSKIAAFQVTSFSFGTLVASSNTSSTIFTAAIEHPYDD
jgi:hypothetical protein